MPEVVRDNHYVPQALIRRWSADDLHVHAYRLLVSHAAVPPWSLQSIKTVAYARDLYTEVDDGEERVRSRSGSRRSSRPRDSRPWSGW